MLYLYIKWLRWYKNSKNNVMQKLGEMKLICSNYDDINLTLTI